jgi:hypothetical protein
LLGDGKLDGPDARTKIKWTDILFLPFIFFGRAAIIFLTLLYHINYTSIITRAAISTDRLWDSLSNQIMLWFFFILWGLFYLPPVQYIYWWTWTILRGIFCTVFGIPIIFFSFFNSVYHFGPQHIEKRSLYDILSQPVPKVAFNGSTQEFGVHKKRENGIYGKIWSNQCKTRFHRRPIPRKILRSKRLVSKKDRATKRTQEEWSGCPHSHVTPIAERNCIYSSYNNPHAGSFGAGPAEANMQMAMTIHFAINCFSPPQILYLPNPKRPPDGLITEAIMMSVVMIIFGIITTKYLCRMYAYISLRWTRRNARCLVKTKQFYFLKSIYQIITNASFCYPWKCPGAASFLADQFEYVGLLTSQEVMNFFTRGDFLNDSENSNQVLCDVDDDDQDLYYFDASEGYDIFCECFQHQEEIEQTIKVKLEPGQAIVRAFASTGEERTAAATFDAASSFWVCDNSATGHICNDKTLYHGPLVPSVFVVGTATGTIGKLMMGTVILSLRDDEGIEHTFTLSEVVHMKDSPVNILSTRRLAELFPGSKGSVDHKGTGVSSFFDSTH